MAIYLGRKQLQYRLARAIFTTGKWQRDHKDSPNKIGICSPIPESELQNTSIPSGKIMRGIGDTKDIKHILHGDLNVLFRKKQSNSELIVPRETDICVIGGGAVGLSVAYWLKQRNPVGFTCSIIEKDPTYEKSATMLSLGGLRQQFSLPEYLEMSKLAAEFFRELGHKLRIIDYPPPDIEFNHQGHLILATEEYLELLKTEYELLQSQKASVSLLTPTMLQEKFPWLNVHDLAAGTYGLQNEGWCNPLLLLAALKTKLASWKTNFINGEVVGFGDELQHPVMYKGKVQRRQRLTCVLVKMHDGNVYPMRFAMCMNCAGPMAGEIARLAGIGVKDQGALSVPLPITAQKRYVYRISCPGGPGLTMPVIDDPSGLLIRRDGIGGFYLCSINSDPQELDDELTCTVDENYFNDHVLPLLVNRIPAFKDAELVTSTASYIDSNYYDGLPVVGQHPYHRNLYFAAGAGIHALQHAPAIGRALMEYVIDDEFVTIDMTNFSFDRFLDAACMLDEM